jgi:hypothetical protein
MTSPVPHTYANAAQSCNTLDRVDITKRASPGPLALPPALSLSDPLLGRALPSALAHWPVRDGELHTPAPSPCGPWPNMSLCGLCGERIYMAPGPACFSNGTVVPYLVMIIYDGGLNITRLGATLERPRCSMDRHIWGGTAFRRSRMAAAWPHCSTTSRFEPAVTIGPSRRVISVSRLLACLSDSRVARRPSLGLCI